MHASRLQLVPREAADDTGAHHTYPRARLHRRRRRRATPAAVTWAAAVGRGDGESEGDAVTI